MCWGFFYFCRGVVMIKILTGVGSRETPPDVLVRMGKIAKSFSSKGFVLRSGGAKGADQAFENNWKGGSEIFLPWNGYEGRWVKNGYIVPALTQAHYELAERCHPAWDRCTDGAKKMHCRNTCQVMGEHLDSPTGLLVCWTREGKYVGGTAVAMRIAAMNGIPIYNLAIPEAVIALRELYNSL